MYSALYCASDQNFPEMVQGMLNMVKTALLLLGTRLVRSVSNCKLQNYVPMAMERRCKVLKPESVLTAKSLY